MSDNERQNKQNRAILALLSNPNVRSAAASIKVSEQTLFRWLRDSAFQTEYQTAKREAVQQATAYLRNSLGEAVGVIIGIMNDTKSSPGVRLAAAKAVLELGIRAVELEDIEVRLSALEAEQK